MKIRYAGTATVRLIGTYRFDAANDYTCEVAEPELAAELLTQPGLDFVVAEDDPLAVLVGAEQAAELTLNGITTVADYEAKAPQRGKKFFREEVGHQTIK